jgi:ATP-binding protein involved in chromosome partitioning
MSIGFLVPNQEAIIWRGPMLVKMLQQFLHQVAWGNPDFLIVDLPPGTGDVQLSLSQLIPLTGAIIVTTPQDVALADVQRSVKMFEKTSVPLMGVIENMSYFEAPDTGKLPTREAGDQGKPIVAADPECAQTSRFREIAKQIIAQQGAKESAGELELPVVSEAYE